MTTQAKEDRRILRKPELQHMIGLSDASIWRMERQGKFPKRIKIGGKSVGWFSDEISEWFEKRAAARK
jgi:prophage regulatory protein